MPNQLHLSCLIDLPSDVFEAAKITANVSDPWQAMLTDLKTSGVAHTHTSETIETRAKPATNGTRAPRRTKAQMQADAAAASQAAQQAMNAAVSGEKVG